MTALRLIPFVVCGLASTAFGDDLRPFLAKYCVDCHGADEPRAGLRLDRLEGYRAEDAKSWRMVHERLADGSMPPKEADQPTDDERRATLAAIVESARAAREAGETFSTRRLNRRELAAALRDVTGLSVDYAAALPGDGRVAGFDTGAAGLQDAADSTSRVMEITRRAVAAIRFLEPAKGEPFTAAPRDVEPDPNPKKKPDPRKVLDPWKQRGANPKVRGFLRPGVGLLTEPKWLGERGGQEFTFPVPPNGNGVMRLELVLAAYSAFQDVPDPHLWIEVGGTAIDHVRIDGSVQSPNRLVYEIQLDDLPIDSKGVKLTLSNRVELPYGVKGFENEDKTKPEEKIDPGLFRPVYDKKSKDPDAMPVPFVVLQEITVDLDHVAAWPPEEWGVDVGEATDSPEYADRLLAVWIERAWRRPVSEAEREPFRALYERLRKRGMDFDPALRTAFQSVLMSGPFRYLAAPRNEDETIAQHAIASRLSFMLWGEPPDRELRDLAARGRLRDPKVLDDQVDRLLADPRRDGFVRPFVTQWLEMEQPITLTMDHFSQQDFRFGRYLKESMREETVAYVTELFAANRPAAELVDSDWTMMNDSLAIHYGYEGIDGGHLRRVKLRKDDARGGGILSHAGIQSMLTWMGENWVIYRGAWTLRHVLDDPPPPPPLEVPELIPSDGENRGKSFRELLKQHQQDERCSVCHRTMDPLGFAFQNFDLSGRWRDVEFERYHREELDGKIAWRGQGKSRPVDAAGALPRGETFAGYGEFKRLLVREYLRDVVRGVARNLVLYGTGREADVLDEIEIAAILDRLDDRGYRMRDLVKEVVRSRAFVGEPPA